MEKTKQAVDWIGAYLEWSGADWTPPRQAALQAAETDFCAAYLDWMDTGAIAGRQRRERLRQTTSQPPCRRGATGVDPASPEPGLRTCP